MKKAFVPVCLYSNGFFLIKENIRFFLHIFSDYDEILFVIVDRLYGNNLLIKEKVTNEEDAFMAFTKRGADIYSLLNNSIQEQGKIELSKTKITIKKWDEIAEKESDYKILKSRIIDVFDSNPVLDHYSTAFILNNLKILTNNNITEYKKQLEHDYLFSEIAMSIYLTEYCGYTDEIWERAPKTNLPDPIDILYNSEKVSLYLILGHRNSTRKQLYLNDIIDSYLDGYSQ